MEEWKQAWQLSKTELKRRPLFIIGTVLIFIIAALLLGIGYSYYITENPLLRENNPGIYDLMFFLLFWIVPYWMRPKEFRYHMISSDFWGTPYFIKLMQLPIPDSVIVKHRFVSHMVVSVPCNVLFLLLFYIITGVTEVFISPLTFIVFSIIWMCFSIYAGNVFPTSDAGDKMSPLKLVLSYILTGGVALGAFMFIEVYSPYSAVEWTVVFATKWPLLSAGISIGLAFLGMRYWMYHMKKTMHKLDYLYG